eukprot:118639-Lingulodinium_polyedra.AAC.1
MSRRRVDRSLSSSAPLLAADVAVLSPPSEDDDGNACGWSTVTGRLTLVTPSLSEPLSLSAEEGMLR